MTFRAISALRSTRQSLASTFRSSRQATNVEFLPLLTLDSGDLLVAAQDVLVPSNGPTTATFTAKTHPATVFSAFKAQAEIDARPSAPFDINGRFTLGTASNATTVAASSDE
jgi:hypothetical protein